MKNQIKTALLLSVLTMLIVWAGFILGGRTGMMIGLILAGSMNATPSTAHMFIVNPLSNSRLNNLFSSHPPLEKRIALLRGEPPTVQPSENWVVTGTSDAWRHLSGQ